MLPLIAHNLDAIRALTRDFGVARLELFGSACTPDFDPEQSDIDILVEVPPDYDFGPWLKRFHELQRALTALLDHQVDLIDVWALRNPWFSREAAKTRQVVYDASCAAEVA